MSSRRLLKRIHPEGIPWPGSIVYNALSGTGIFHRHYELVARDILAYCPSGRVLDVGTGPGRLLVELHAIAPDIGLTGVDISDAMVDKARENMVAAGIADAVELRTAGAASLPFDDNAFDVVVSTGSMHHWKDAVGGLNEIHRILRPGGHALMYDLVKNTPKDVMRRSAREYGRFRIMLLWLHSFEEPFVSVDEIAALAAQTRFGRGDTRFVGVLCCLAMRKEP